MSPASCSRPYCREFFRESFRRAAALFALSSGALFGADFVASNGVARATEPAEAARKVDQLLKQETQTSAPSAESAGRPAARVDDEAFLRRASLDLIGAAPTAEQIVLFSLDGRPDKRSREVERLLADKRYGENWARFWRDVIFYRRTEERSFLASEACTSFLTRQFNDEVSWDKVATSFITAEGDVMEKGETAIIFAQAGMPEDTVSELSRIFLGIQIQCAQCHDHPTDRWKREQFHQLAAFFPRVAVRPNNVGDKRGFLVTVNDREFSFRGMGGGAQRFRGTPEHYMPDKENPTARGTLVEPVLFATQQRLPTGVKDDVRRGALALWMTSSDNPWFAKAYVNRIWAELCGEGFYEPVDDMGPDRQCSAEQTLDYLAAGFCASGYDPKWLFRTITATEAYQRESRGRRTADDPPFVANVSQRLRGDQLFTNLVAALGIQEPTLAAAGSRPGAGMMLRRSPRVLFNAVFGYDPSAPREEIAGSIPQALVLMNSTTINQMISTERGSLRRMLAEIRDDEQLTVELYLRTLSREPSDQELTICKDYVRQVGNRAEAFEDVQWSLINSAEFLHRK